MVHYQRNTWHIILMYVHMYELVAEPFHLSYDFGQPLKILRNPNLHNSNKSNNIFTWRSSDIVVTCKFLSRPPFFMRVAWSREVIVVNRNCPMFMQTNGSVISRKSILHRINYLRTIKTPVVFYTRTLQTCHTIFRQIVGSEFRRTCFVT